MNPYVYESIFAIEMMSDFAYSTRHEFCHLAVNAY